MRRLKGHTGTVNSVAFNPDGTKIVSGSWDRSIKIWNVKNGKLIKTWEAHPGPSEEYRGHPLYAGWVNSVAFNHDGTKIVSGLHDKSISIKIWSTPTDGKKSRRWFPFMNRKKLEFTELSTVKLKF